MLRRLLLGQKKCDKNVTEMAKDETNIENDCKDITKPFMVAKKGPDEQRKTKQLKYESESEEEGSSTTDNDYSETEYSTDYSDDEDLKDIKKIKGFKLAGSMVVGKEISCTTKDCVSETINEVLLNKEDEEKQTEGISCKDEENKILKKNQDLVQSSNRNTKKTVSFMCSEKDDTTFEKTNNNITDNNSNTITITTNTITMQKSTDFIPAELNEQTTNGLTHKSTDIPKPVQPLPLNTQTTSFTPRLNSSRSKQKILVPTDNHGKMPLGKCSVRRKNTTKTMPGQRTSLQKQINRKGVENKERLGRGGTVREEDNSKKRRLLKSQKFNKTLNCDISVEDLEKIVDFGQLEDVIKKTKEHKVQIQVIGIKEDREVKKVIGVADNVFKDSIVGESREIIEKKQDEIEDVKVEGKQEEQQQRCENNPKTEQPTDARSSPDGCQAEECESKEKRETSKDEISSDSGVSESNGDTSISPVGQRYMSRKGILKRKENLKKEIVDLEARVAVMEEHRKDVQYVYDVLDFYNDNLKEVERNNVGVPCVLSLKSILACQIREMSDGEFQMKIKSLENLGVPQFNAVYTCVEKLQTNLSMSLKDDKLCRSKGVQNMRFEIGRILGMCQGLLDCIYKE